LTKLAKNNNII